MTANNVGNSANMTEYAKYIHPFNLSVPSDPGHFLIKYPMFARLASSNIMLKFHWIRPMPNHNNNNKNSNQFNDIESGAGRKRKLNQIIDPSARPMCVCVGINNSKTQQRYFFSANIKKIWNHLGSKLSQAINLT